MHLSHARPAAGFNPRDPTRPPSRTLARRRATASLPIAASGCLLLLLAGCADGPYHRLRLELPADYPDRGYEVWAIFADAAEELTVDATGNAFSTSRDLAEADAVAVTGFGFTWPAAVWAGPVAGDHATLDLADPRGLGADFSMVRGQYVLATPTNGPDTDERSGLWFLGIYEPNDPPMPGLVLPAATAAFRYEGWVTITGTLASLGPFSAPDAADLDNSHAGPLEGPPFPGEDLLAAAPEGTSLPTDLRGQRVFVTVEASSDDDPAPSPLMLLSDDIPADAEDHLAYFLDPSAGNGITARLSP